jgi:glyoxylase-like metal-dependent hydrolase (beta-lactamase superfamily II)
VLSRVVRILALALLAFAGMVGAGLGLAHWEIRSLGGPLPTDAAVAGLASAADLPVRISAINTASQPMPRSAVLDAARDPDPAARYVLGHAAFLLEWSDGRKLLVDLGMEPAAALEFGAPAELIGAEPIVPYPDATVRLGEAVAEGEIGLLLTHLHPDHVQGAGALCAARGGSEVALFQTAAQAERHNYTTRPGVALLGEAECLRAQRLGDAPLAEVPGFAGVGVVHAAGHTPGSQVVLAAVREPGGVRRVALLGDVVNCADGARHDVPKPFAYRLLMVPESDQRLGELRRWLARLESEQGFELAPTHDELTLTALGLFEHPIRASATRAAPGS